MHNELAKSELFDRQRDNVTRKNGGSTWMTMFIK